MPKPSKESSLTKATAATVGYEAELWQMADALRGSMDAAEYKHVVLGLIFLKYISDAFEEQHAKLEAERAHGADPEDPDEYRGAEHPIFWVPPEARWPHLKAQAKQPTIGQLVDDAMGGIERDNPALKAVLPRDYARPALDKLRLGQLIDLVSNIRVGDADSRAKDVLGRVYEYFLSQFASAEGKKGGEFYTPRCVVKLLVEMLEPYQGRVYDPCCGSSGMFVQSVEFIRAHAKGNGNPPTGSGQARKAGGDISIYGQESNYTTWRLAKMNLSIRGIEGQIAHWESTFRSWGQPPSQTERAKCAHAEQAVRKAIAASSALAARSINAFAQGSYANRTNVREDSDVDICVLCRDVFYYDPPAGVLPESYGITPASYEYAQFKNEVGAALSDYFGYSAVTRGNKAFDVHANSYRVDADAVPTFEYRRYTSASAYNEGTKFIPDNGGEVINWPTQNYDNGVSKNQRTGERFKAIVRIMKRLRNEMNEAAIGAAKPIPSFLNECLVWNVPNDGFGHDTYKEDVRFVIAHLWNNTRTVDSCSEWGEINELKYLFRNAQPWTREQTNTFLQAAWTYIGFE